MQAPQATGTGPGSGPSWHAAAASAGRSAVHRLTELESGSVIAATILLVVVVGAFRPGFLSAGQLTQMVQQASFIALLAVVMAAQVAPATAPKRTSLPSRFGARTTGKPSVAALGRVS